MKKNSILRFVLSLTALAVVIFVGIWIMKSFQVDAPKIAKNDPAKTSESDKNDKNDKNDPAKNFDKSEKNEANSGVKENSSDNKNIPSAPSADAPQSSNIPPVAVASTHIATTGPKETLAEYAVMAIILAAGYFYLDSRKLARNSRGNKEIFS